MAGVRSGGLPEKWPASLGLSIPRLPCQFFRQYQRCQGWLRGKVNSIRQPHHGKAMPKIQLMLRVLFLEMLNSSGWPSFNIYFLYCFLRCKLRPKGSANPKTVVSLSVLHKEMPRRHLLTSWHSTVSIS